MKSKDITLLVVIAVFSGFIAFMASNLFLASPKNLKQQVEVVEPISTEFASPDERYFNANAINPTQMIRISEGEKPNPFE